MEYGDEEGSGAIAKNEGGYEPEEDGETMRWAENVVVKKKDGEFDEGCANNIEDFGGDDGLCTISCLVYVYSWFLGLGGNHIIEG